MGIQLSLLVGIQFSSASQLSLLLFFSVVFIMISSFGVDLFFFLSFRCFQKYLFCSNPPLVLLCTSCSPNQLFLFRPSPLVVVRSPGYPTRLCLFFDCVACLRVNCPIFLGKCGICDLHIFAYCPGFFYICCIVRFSLCSCCCDCV